MSTLDALCLKLHEIGAVKFGEFKLKDGSLSPIYIDLRLLVAYPDVLELVAGEMAILARNLKFNRLCGIPYAALPIATALSLNMRLPMIYPRREVKQYGTKKPIEGLYSAGETVLVIDDLITTGLSKFEFIQPLEQEGLHVKDILVLIDREQGGAQALKEKGYALHSVLGITFLLNTLTVHNKITKEKADEILAYLKKAN